MEKKKFASVALNPKYETFIVYVTSFESTPFVASLNSTLLNADIHLFCESQIFDLIAKKALTKASNKYVDFANVFSLDLISKLPKYTRINNHTIKLVDS